MVTFQTKEINQPTQPTMKSINLTSLLILPAAALQMHRPHTTKHWCQSVVDPEWPFAYSKYFGQIEEPKGRVSTNRQDVRHVCDTRGVRSKCHVCEDFECQGDDLCHFQLQGVKWEDMSQNIPTVSDVPWAVGGRHRYDFGGATTSHVCVYLSGAPPCQSSYGTDYSMCKLRCWGYGMTGTNASVTSATRMEGDADGVWPNHRLDSLHGVNSTPWTERTPTITWEYPKSDVTDGIPVNPIAKGENYTLNSQGFVFTSAGSQKGEEGFSDGVGSDARFRHPEGVAVDHDGYIYVADTGNHAIRMISPAGSVQTLAGTGSSGYRDGLASDGAQFSSPTDIVVWRDWAWWPVGNSTDTEFYRNGNGTLVLFVADTDNHRIRKLTGDISYLENGVKTWSNVLVECFSGRCKESPEPGLGDGDKGSARFDSPQGITVSHDGRVFVADTNNHQIREVDRFGSVKTIAGSTVIAESKRNGLEVEGCPEPCLSGDPGASDGSSSNSRFVYPSDVALNLEATAVFVADRHHIRRLDLENQTVTTLAGGNNEGERDGLGSEATLNNPASIAVTGDGVLYFVDYTACRVRRVSRPYDFLPTQHCDADLASIMRPQSCSSYNTISDELGTTASPVQGNIHYNYMYRNKYDHELGHDFIGRTLKHCVGSPPTSLLDKRHWNETTVEYPFNYNLVMDDMKSHVREDPNDGTSITVSCPIDCPGSFIFDDIIQAELAGIVATNFYGELTPVCKAAQNEGMLSNSTSGLIDVTIVSEATIRSVFNNMRPISKQYFFISASSLEMRIQTIAGAPSSLRGKTCGYVDSFPPQNSKFHHPSGLGVYTNASLDGTHSFLFIADRDNHVIRAVSAVCTFGCENGGSCIGPDKCQCKEGWTGIDCTNPICQNPCSPRQVCAAPNVCVCIPGFKGEFCEQATCVQECRNGGHCSAPDTCSCAPGWFDSNCTTPVCEQTCGNGANCTGPNTCSCPTDWTGFDCRKPVCKQTCHNGASCVAPDTCLCPPSWSGHDCSQPVCHQGFFVPHNEQLENTTSTYTPSYWVEYHPCRYSEWCTETNGFECAQKKQSFALSLPLFGEKWRYKTGRKDRPEECMMLEIGKDIISNFQYLSASDNSTTPHFRYSPKLPYDWQSNIKLPWNAYDRPTKETTQPYVFEIDRQVAMASLFNVTQGKYMCANGGKCVGPDICSCSKGWMGFDCRVPVCEQGYHESELESFVKGPKTDRDFIVFKPFLDPRRKYDLDSAFNFSSNPAFEVWVEEFVNASSLHRKLVVVNSSMYYASDSENAYQGGYECSIRSVTEWENANYILDHPNYYSRYMDTKTEGDGEVYSSWTEMNFPPTHHKTARLIKYNWEFVDSSSQINQSFVYTDVGHMIDGVWKVTGAKWRKGNCIVEFERRCDGAFEHVKLSDIADEVTGILVQDTDTSFRPQLSYDDKRTYISGRWFTSEEEVCVDRVIRGCFNNGTCAAPNTCECSSGWTGRDCSIPVCEQNCLHNGNCTNPNVCTCERGWSGDDCGIALCPQECKNGGQCVAPDTCRCMQWENTWRDNSFGGGVPLFQKPDGDPQLTGWTGYDCNTPICVQAERFRLNIDPSTASRSDIIPLGGHKDRDAECNEYRCPEFNEMLTQNDGKSFQSGCGWDMLETGCCFMVESSAFSCFRCLDLVVKDRNATCSHGALQEWKFKTKDDVPLTFRSQGVINLCGKDLSPELSHFKTENVTATSNLFLCNRFQWEQGDYVDEAGLANSNGIGADFGLKRGRHIRLNYNNYQRSQNDTDTWMDGPVEEGEGIFECYNFGSCIAPDECSCRDGYGGFDCNTPQCRHEQYNGEIAGCQNGGICRDKDDCHCIQVESLLWKVHENARRGLTGWTGTDCSMPMCIQGFYDPECNASEYAPGMEGCYRCANGGLCISPDMCLCAEGWTGYDCRSPVCKAETTPLIRKQLMTSDPSKIDIFENDPCGMRGFNSLRDDGPRGVCTMPNQCTCNCFGSYDDLLCKKLGGKHCKKAFHDPLFRRRDVLAPNEIFGTRDCWSGYEGLVDENDMFGSCHLTIYEPSVFNKYTSLLVTSFVISFICICLLLGCIWRALTRRAEAQRKSRQRVKSKKTEVVMHAFAYEDRKKR